MRTKTTWFKIVVAFTLIAILGSGINVGSATPLNNISQNNSNGSQFKVSQPVGPDKPSTDPNKIVRVIVRLTDAPLATYAGGVKGYRATSPKAIGAKKMDLNSAESVSYEQYLRGKQAEFISQLSQALPNAVVERSYQIVLNGLTVKIRYGDLLQLRKLDGLVGMYLEKEYTLQMDASLPLIGLGSGAIGGSWTDAGLWQSVGGHANAGKGLKIADIDSGITPGNPCFDPTGYTFPSDFPKGETVYTTAKVIVARSYFRADDPPYFPATPLDDPGDEPYQGGHGTHTAGTMACNYGTEATLFGTKISGVAPQAQVMVYRVFYYSVAGSHSAWTPELIAAIEDAVKDGADVVNNSWSGSNINSIDDPEVLAYEAAVDAGVVVVFSAGNSGPNPMTLGNPGGNSDKFITVAASTTDRVFGYTLNVVNPTVGAPADLLTGVVAIPGDQTIISSPIEGNIKFSSTNLDGCAAFPADYFDGAIALMQRGNCSFYVKVENATTAGAIAVVIYNNAAGQPIIMSIKYFSPTTTKSVMVDKVNGDALKAFVEANPTTVVHISATIKPFTFPGTDDALASFSSRGPTADIKLKPDISAPGVNILSSVSALALDDSTPTFELYTGTSMAAPHVTGAAALMLQAHPNWTPAQIKSALMSTAVEPATLGSKPSDRGAGRLDLTQPDKVGLTFDAPSLSFGLLAAGDPAETLTVTAKNETSAASVYTFTVASTSSNPIVVSLPGSPSPVVTMTVPANSTAQFKVTMTPASAEETYGKVTLTPSNSILPVLHIPFYARITTDIPAADVLLIDDDFSSNDPVNCPDYQGVYTQTLTSLGYTYNVFVGDADLGFSSQLYDQARRHKMVLYFSGTCGNNLSFYPTDLSNYMAQGGRMLIMGQDIGYWDTYFAPFGYTMFPAVFFGGAYAKDNVFAGALFPAVGGTGDFSPFMQGVVYGVDPSSAPSVDEITPKFWTDVDALPILGNPQLPGTISGGYMGTRMSYEPTIERLKGEQPSTPIPYRGLWVSFGLESVIPAPLDYTFTTPQQARLDLLSRLFNWLEAKISVTPDQNTFFTNQPGIAATLSATSVDDNMGDNVYAYRWDFGDGSPIYETLANPLDPTVSLVNHKYPAMGTYKGYVEVWDIFGHKDVKPFVVNVGYIIIFLPIVTH